MNNGWLKELMLKFLYDIRLGTLKRILLIISLVESISHYSSLSLSPQNLPWSAQVWGWCVPSRVAVEVCVRCGGPHRCSATGTYNHTLRCDHQALDTMHKIVWKNELCNKPMCVMCFKITGVEKG